jgi:DNA (cytosine-5)-methyltransferase 1
VGGVDVRHGSLFSGIGGFDLASEWMGWENVFHCEWNEFGKKVLKYYWPKAKSYEDITTTDFTIHRGKIDILTGGFPCQPYSTAGKRLGKEDDRHLWPEMLRAIREIQPTYVVGENVLGLVNWNGGLVFNEVQADLEAEGYEVQPFVLPACAVNAPHRRDRVWFVAYCNHSRNATPSSRTNGKQSEESIERQQPQLEHCGFSTTENATNPNSWGLEGSIKVRRNGKYVERKNGTHLQVNNAANTKCEGLSWGNDTGKESNGNWENSKLRGSSTRCNKEINNNAGNATNPKSNGQHECDSNNEINAGQGGINAQRDIEQIHTKQPIAEHTDCIRQERRMHPDKPEITIRKQLSERDARSTQSTSWKNFPTQPPICIGNDGLSSRLDNITFSKWRNESIKAAGNAIVPQVVYQIFQAISKMP